MGILPPSTSVSGIHLFFCGPSVLLNFRAGVAFCQGTSTRCEACSKAGPLFHSWTCCGLKWFEDPKSESNIYIWCLKTVKTFKIKKMMKVFFWNSHIPKLQGSTTGHCIESFVHGFCSWQVHGLSAKRWSRCGLFGIKSRQGRTATILP